MREAAGLGWLDDGERERERSKVCKGPHQYFSNLCRRNMIEEKGERDAEDKMFQTTTVQSEGSNKVFQGFIQCNTSLVFPKLQQQ